MTVKHNHSLKSLNTFGLEATANSFISVCNDNDIFEILVMGFTPIRILGGGSNILLTGHIDGYTLKNEIKGIEIIDEDAHQVLVQVGAGESWHTFVLWSLSHNLGGLENLSLIPGSVGAAPMQNIGAYGVEQDVCFHSLTGINLTTGVKTTFFKHQCKFGYRESIFKNDLKDQFIITQVRYLLKKTPHLIHTEYGAIKDQLKMNGINEPTIQEISDAVIAIRQSKLPDPRKIGNAGSFFKNPVILVGQYERLKSIYSDIPCYPIDTELVKIPAGWLIEKLGYKGKVFDSIGVHRDQALVLVNYGGGKGNDIYELALEIIAAVKNEFDIAINPEVNIW
jgi:UDP-N-acetylmuramate dehydrogenase